MFVLQLIFYLVSGVDESGSIIIYGGKNYILKQSCSEVNTQNENKIIYLIIAVKITCK